MRECSPGSSTTSNRAQERRQIASVRGANSSMAATADVTEENNVVAEASRVETVEQAVLVVLFTQYLTSESLDSIREEIAKLESRKGAY